MIHNFTLRARAESGARARSGADRKRTRSATLLRTLNRFSPMDLEQSWKNGIHIPVLRSRNYLFSAPAPPLSIISAPAPAPAIYCNLKLYYNTNSSTKRNMSQWRFFFILASSKLTPVNIY